MTIDEEETARLVLMDIRAGHAPRSMVFLHSALLEFCGRKMDITEIQEVWERYMGMDGRTLPTHDLDTGQRITPQEGT